MHLESGPGNREQALCESALNLEEKLAYAQSQLAEGYFESAIDVFSECLLFEPDESRALQGRALAYFKLKKWAEAISDFKKAKELNSDEPENWVGLGMSLAMTNQIYEAIDIFDELLRKQPNFTRGYIQLGRLYYQLGIIKKGNAQLELALASRPSLPERRMIEEMLKEQRVLDKKRFYRPDFEALHKGRKESFLPESWKKRMNGFWQLFRKGS